MVHDRKARKWQGLDSYNHKTILEGQESRDARPLFKTQGMGDFRGVKSISMDMWDVFIKAARENFENANSLIAFDRYHVAQHLNKAQTGCGLRNIGNWRASRERAN